MSKMLEAITSVQDFESRLRPLSELEIFKFMNTLHPGTFFNMGMYSVIPVASKFKDTIFIYKVINMTAIVSGVDYENIKTTKDFRNSTGKGKGDSWYDHMPGYENKVGIKRSDQTSKYVLWDVKAGSDNWFKFYIVDSTAGTVTPASKEDLKQSIYLNDSVKSKLDSGEKSKGVDITTGKVIENQTVWRTAAFSHIFWLDQANSNAGQYGTKFVEGKANMDKLKESESLFRDAHAHITTDIDAIISGQVIESADIALVEHHHPELEDWYCDECGKKMDYETMQPYYNDEYDQEELICLDCQAKLRRAGLFESRNKRNRRIKESYRRIVSRGKTLIDNDLFVDFE
jgi:hypothetical protein